MTSVQSCALPLRKASFYSVRSKHFSIGELLSKPDCLLRRRRILCRISASAVSMEERTPIVPTWAKPLVCSGNVSCCDGECEYLHLSKEQRMEPCVSPPDGGKLVICAGPERSGSTWLFNALRFLLETTGQRVHSYWINHLTQSKLIQRGYKRTSDAAHILVKTHKWSEDWDPTSADLIVLTERDICGVVNSYIRVGWLPKDMRYLKSYIVDYLKDHNRWKEVAHLIIHYEDIADVGGRELLCLNQLLNLLHFNSMDVASISERIKNIPVPQYGPDPVTKLWPRHTKESDKNFARRPSLSEEECRDLREHAIQFM
ncbi:hypothetical protein KP509_11G092500 [Ceratopteris richardii]|uniref:Sulfotransferase domain-containing protein n=1 Tax=Ceratopteris richardii TaxID=49495 RepID=A0A8T2U0R1_CERRI|nr:hypothetical protein KP509_11G092500 [Ceratopteris richardii]